MRIYFARGNGNSSYIPFLIQVLDHPQFVAAAIDTRFLDRESASIAAQMPTGLPDALVSLARDLPPDQRAPLNRATAYAVPGVMPKARMIDNIHAAADARSDMVLIVRCLALLELFKQGMVELDQAERFGDIDIVWTVQGADTDGALAALDDYEG